MSCYLPNDVCLSDDKMSNVRVVDLSDPSGTNSACTVGCKCSLHRDHTYKDLRSRSRNRTSTYKDI